MEKTTNKRPAEPLTRAEILAILKACGKRGPLAIRNRALFTIMWRAGLRPSEALALREKDIDFDEGTIRVLHGKRDKSRTVAVDVQAMELLRAWKQDRERRGKVEWKKAPFFCSLRGQPLAPSYTRHVIRTLAAKVGIQKRVHPHALRHAFALDLDTEGVALRLISAALGHSDVKTTSVYLSRLRPREVVEAILNRPNWLPERERKPRET